MFADRLPSRHDMFLMFASCVFPVHAWATFAFLFDVPSLAMRMALWDILGAGAYTLSFALFESVLLMGLFTLVAILLPARFVRDDFVVKGTGVLYVSLPWLFLFLLDSDRAWVYVVPLAGLLLSLRLFGRLFSDFPFVPRAIRSLVDRLSVLSYLYVALDLLAVLVVILRNV